MGKYRFRVRLRQFRATDLVGHDLDPFVKVNFDSFKKFHTNSASGNHPKWDTDTQFVYETQYADKLHRKRVVLMVYSKNTISSDDLLGQVDVDLKTLACGPAAQDVQLWNESKPAGRLHFTCDMEEVGSCTLFVKDMLVTGLPFVDGEAPSTHVVVSAHSFATDAKHAAAGKHKKEKIEIKTDTKTATADPEFLAFEQLRFTATLKELWTEGIEVRVYSDGKAKRGLMGSVSLPFEKYHSFKDLAIVSFKEQLNVTGEFKASGQVWVQGALYFKGFPTHAQMVGGLHTENGVADGRPFAKGVVLPPNLNAEPAEPPGHEDDDDHSQLSREHHAAHSVSVSHGEMPLSVDHKSAAGGSRSRNSSDAKAPSASAAAAAALTASPASEGHGRHLSVDSAKPGHARNKSGGGSDAAAAGAALARSPSPSPSPPPGGAPHVVASPASAHGAVAVQVAYTPMVAPNTALPKGIAGWCFACGKTADYVDSQTKMPVCGRECKLAWLEHVAKHAPAAQPPQHHSTPSTVAAVAAVNVALVADQQKKVSAAAVAAAASSPLPSGWEQKIDPGSGRVFYQNNVTKTTQWHRPDPTPAAAPGSNHGGAGVGAAILGAAVAGAAAVPGSNSHAVKAAPAPAAAVPVPAPASLPKASPPVADKSWACPKCTFLNAEIAVACIQCRTPAPSVAAAAKPKPPAEPALPPGHWSCSACTLANPPLALMCSVCRAPKPLSAAPAPAPAPAPPKPPAGWSCPACTMINAVSAAKCDACGKANPNAAPKPPAAGGAAAVPAAKKPSSLTEPLPAGWEAAWDHAHGRVYYKNHATKKTQWHKPTEPAMASGAGAPRPPAGAAPAGGQPMAPQQLSQLPPDIQRLVAQGASVTVYQPGHPALNQLLGQPGVQVMHQPAAGGPLQMHPNPHPQQVVHAPAALYRTPDGRFVDAQGRPVQLA